MQTKAAIAHAAGQPLSVETVDLEGPSAGEVLIEVMATGICHADAFTLSGGNPEGIFPSILGHEGAGIVREVGQLEQHRRHEVDRLDELEVFFPVLFGQRGARLTGANAQLICQKHAT